jgi:aspartyl protease family protein
MRSIMIFAAVIAGLGVFMAQMAAKMAPAPASATTTHVAVIDTSEQTGGRSLSIPRDARGHFETEGRIEGQRIGFMVDTGASVIALTEKAAATLGIHPAEQDYVSMVKTANGTVRAAPVELDRVEIGDLVVRDVAALVLPDSALSDNLLGLTFLSRLHRFAYSDGKLVLEQ